MLHAGARSHLLCPAYCLLPDHLHLVWMGLRQQSDQLKEMKFLRIHLDPALGDQRQWQHQPHDHVLRPGECQRNAFWPDCAYILANPVRAQLVKNEAEWSYSGAIVPGYPELNPFKQKFWPSLWKIYEGERKSRREVWRARSPEQATTQHHLLTSVVTPFHFVLSAARLL